jgi:hypothetical protein
MIQNAILNYIDHLEDTTYLASVLARSDSQSLIDGIVGLLHDPDHDLVGRACLFIRDLILVAPQHGIGLAFRDSFDASPIVSALEQLVLAPNHFIRQHTIYTLGKIGSTTSLPKLYLAFQMLCERDPILLPRLVGEILWLEKPKNWRLIERMTASQQYTTRWAALSTLESFAHDIIEDTELVEVKRQCFAQLRGDSHQLVQNEAEYVYQHLVFEQRLSQLTKAERRQQRKELERHRAAVTFSDIEIRYNNQLYTHHIIDYSTADLEQFITDVARSNIGSK